MLRRELRTGSHEQKGGDKESYVKDGKFDGDGFLLDHAVDMEMARTLRELCASEKLSDSVINRRAESEGISGFDAAKQLLRFILGRGRANATWEYYTELVPEIPRTNAFMKVLVDSYNAKQKFDREYLRDGVCDVSSFLVDNGLEEETMRTFKRLYDTQAITDTLMMDMRESHGIGRGTGDALRIVRSVLGRGRTGDKRMGVNFDLLWEYIPFIPEANAFMHACIREQQRQERLRSTEKLAEEKKESAPQDTVRPSVTFSVLWEELLTKNERTELADILHDAQGEDDAVPLGLKISLNEISTRPAAFGKIFARLTNIPRVQELLQAAEARMSVARVEKPSISSSAVGKTFSLHPRGRRVPPRAGSDFANPNSGQDMYRYGLWPGDDEET